jgi:hypothetical protein
MCTRNSAKPNKRIVLIEAIKAIIFASRICSVFLIEATVPRRTGCAICGNTDKSREVELQGEQSAFFKIQSDDAAVSL